MKKRNKIQTAIATGRFTLPVVAIIVLFIWLISMGPGTEVINMLLFAATGYLLIELNTTFSLIRVRTTLHVSIYWIATSVCIFLHPFNASSFIPLLFTASLFFFLNSYEHTNPAPSIFSSALFLSAASILFPYIIYYAPLLILSMISFRCMNVKSILAALIGLITPYWFFFAYTFLTDNTDIFFLPFAEITKISPMDFSKVGLGEIVTSIVILSLSFICSIYYISSSYLDRIRSRASLTFIILIELWGIVLWLLYPSTTVGIMQIQILCYSLLAGHFFAVTKNRFSNIFLIITIICFIFLAVFNIWTQFFSFL